MFKRLTVIVITVFIITIGLLTLGWQDPPTIELYSDSPVTKAYRISQDLGGKWNHYASLRKAWAQESIETPLDFAVGGFLAQGSTILPSNRGFNVVAKKFTVSGKWGSRNSQLVIDGVYGKISVYLNGIDEINFLGAADGTGGSCRFDLPPTRLNFGQENILFIHMAEGVVQESKLLGRIWPEQGRITGPISIEGTPETALDIDRTTASYDFAKQQLTVQTSFRNFSFDEPKPVVLHGIIKENDLKVSECLLPLSTNEASQMVNLIFDLPDVKLWSPDQPHLYELELMLSNSRGEFDSVHIPVGVRKIASTPQKWVVNDQEITVKAQILTQNQEYLIRNALQVEDWLKELKQEGYNVLYFMGFIPNESWLYAADKTGIGIWLEMPVYYSPHSRIPPLDTFKEILLLGQRHPSVLAWTSAIGSQPGTGTENYMRSLQEVISPLPVYYIAAPGYSAGSSMAQGYGLNVSGAGFKAEWGQAVFSQKPSREAKSWPGEKIAAIAWLVWLLIVTFEIIRHKWISYREVINPNPKRAYRLAFFWNALAVGSRLATLGALLTSLLYRLPAEPWPWLPYDLGILYMLKLQNPYLIWLGLTLLLIIARILQVGVAAPFFPNCPGALTLACWLEKRYRWNILPGIAWVLTMLQLPFYFPWYIPLVLYAALNTLYFPLRFRDMIKAKGSVLAVGIIPLTVFTVVFVLIIWNRADFWYLGEISAVLLKNMSIFLLGE